MKQVIVEGELTTVATNGIAISGQEVGSEEEWRIRGRVKGNAQFIESNVGTRVRVTIEVLP